MVPESPRWLIANDRIEEATRILCKFHGGSEEPTNLVNLELNEIIMTLQAEKDQQSTSYLHFFRTSMSPCRNSWEQL